MFDLVDRYEKIHGAAHKRSAPAVGAPALTRQLVLTCDYKTYQRKMDPDDPEYHNPFKHTPSFLDWQARILKGALLTLGDFLRIPEERIDLSVSNTYRQFFTIDGLLVKAVLEYYRDHLKLLIVVEFDPPEDLDGSQPVSLDADDPILGPELASSISGLREKLGFHLNSILATSASTAQLTEAHDFVRNDIWALLDALLCIDNIEGLSECKRLLDLRGCLLAAGESVGQFEKETPNELDTTDLFKNEANLLRATNFLWNFSRLKSYEHNEFVCCTLFRKTCVYMSSIGSHIPKDSEETHREICTFFTMIAPPGSRWQIGRLMYRTNEVASLRLMALKDMHEILTAAKVMTKISTRIERLSDAENDVLKTKQKLEKIQRYKQDIDRLGDSDNSADLYYKIERSRGFAARFFQVLDTMDIERVEGWQPYSDFTQRRLRPYFDRISNVDRRYHDLIGRYHAQLAELTSEIQKENSETLLALQNRYQLQTEQYQEEARAASSFQHKIESFAWAYYGGSILFAIVIGVFSVFPDLAKAVVLNIFGLFPDTAKKITEDKAVLEKASKAIIFILAGILAYINYKLLQWKHSKHHDAAHPHNEDDANGGH